MTKARAPQAKAPTRLIMSPRSGRPMAMAAVYRGRVEEAMD